MNITNELIQHLLMGAGIASAIYWKLGWLKLPGYQLPTPPPMPPAANVTHIQGTEVASPSYKSMSNIPFEVAITPQNQVK